MQTSIVMQNRTGGEQVFPLPVAMTEERKCPYRKLILALKCLALAVLCAFAPAGTRAADLPWRAVEQADLEGIWRQVGVVVIDPDRDRADPWFQATQFFRFPSDGGFRHVLVNPDSEPQRTAPTAIQLVMLEEGPTVQELTWRARGIGILKHPERPQQRIDFGLYLRDAPSGPGNGAVKPKKGDLILVFYSYKDINVPLYYRLLRKQPQR
jgi:hypothetical protein